MPGTSDLHSEEDMLDGLQLRGRSFDMSPDHHSRSPSTEDGSFYLPNNNNASDDDDDNIKSMLFKTTTVKTRVNFNFTSLFFNSSSFRFYVMNGKQVSVVFVEVNF